jgi:hypothetical protein
MGARCVEGAGAAIAARLADMPGDLSTACADLRGYIQTSKLVVGNGRLLSASSAKSSAASAARRPEEGPIMTDDKVQAEAKDPTAAEIEAMVTQARADGFNAATEIVVLCAIAGMPTKAAGFITSRAAIKDVQASLMAAKVEAEKGTEMVTGVMPGESAEKTKEGTAAHGKAKPWREVLRALGFAKKEEK